MWPMIGSLVSAGSSLLGGILGQNNQEQINQENIANQRDFAQHGLSWKVADAKAAGLNPLAALGAQTSSFSNVAGSDSLAQGVSNMGQDIGRAVSAAASSEDRAFITAQRAQQLQRGDLENNLLASQLRLHNQVGDPRGPFVGPTELDGQTSSGGRVGRENVTEPQVGGVAKRLSPDVDLIENVRGGYTPVPSHEADMAGFGSHLAPYQWDNRNIIGAALSSGYGWDNVKKALGGDGKRWHWSFDPTVPDYSRTPNYSDDWGLRFRSWLAN